MHDSRALSPKLEPRVLGVQERPRLLGFLGQDLSCWLDTSSGKDIVEIDSFEWYARDVEYES